jgi:glycosyltransferase involved in cell wall biosynthesis
LTVSTRVAVYGEIDPNLVDGSSIWLQSICQVLTSLDRVEVTLLLRRPLQPERRFLLDALAAHEAVELVDAGRPGLLAPGEAFDLLEELERERGRFDLVVLRGQAVLAEAAGRDAFDGRLWSYAMPGRGMPDETLRLLAARSARLLCQTEAAAEELRGIVPDADSTLLTLPPMIPDFGPPPSRNGASGPLRLVYSGKLAPEYCWLETVETFAALRAAESGAELHVLGDKIHRPPDQPNFYELAARALLETEGVYWHGALPREAVHGLLTKCDLALSVRDPGVESARELSTKVLEYGAAGLPVVLNRAPSYERLLGEDYPLFIDGPEDAAAVLMGPAMDPGLRAAAATACHAVSHDFTFTRVAERLSEHLPSNSTALSPNGASRSAERPTCVLLAGHDFKFTGPLRKAIASAGANLIEDVWKSHTEHDETASRAALEKADVIHCEWCLGNAAWFSRNKRPDQRLIIRLYRVEVFSDYPAAVEIDNVDQVAFDSQHIAEEAVERFGWDPAKLTVIPNAVDFDRISLPKHEAARHTLAMVGYVPKRKHLDRALDVLELLRRRESRFRLMLIGHPPSELGWVARDTDEIEYFRDCYARIQNTDELRGAVTFQPFTEDIPAFLRHAGFILSMSDSEGHQVALAEGTASGAVPVIFDRPGVADQYRPAWIHKTVQQAADAVAAVIEGDSFQDESGAAREHASRWSFDEVLPQWATTLGLSLATDRAVQV